MGSGLPASGVWGKYGFQGFGFRAQACEVWGVSGVPKPSEEADLHQGAHRSSPAVDLSSARKDAF